jgi:GNAT superfamily N-acetyltransferase/uncharacterized protein YdhG (YjbR/CyaY superfamily)
MDLMAYEGELPADLDISPHVRHLATGPAPHLVWFMASRADGGGGVAGLRLSLRSGRIGRDVIGENVVVEELSVDPEHRRAGLGSALPGAATRWVQRRPRLPQRLSLGVETDNEAAIALYDKVGFTIATRGDDHWCSRATPAIPATTGQFPRRLRPRPLPRLRIVLIEPPTGGTAMTEKSFTAEERAAMKERAKELRRGAKADPEQEVLAKIAEMDKTNRVMAERIHKIIKKSAPALTPRLWYGQPAYARDGKVVCFFQSSEKFKTRYATLGFSDEAELDDGSMWPTAYGLAKLTAADEARIAALVQKAIS